MADLAAICSHIPQWRGNFDNSVGFSALQALFFDLDDDFVALVALDLVLFVANFSG